MARRRGDSPTRGEVTERVETNATDLDEKAEQMDVIVEDIETVRGIKDILDFGGTAEGSDEVEQSMEAAEDVTVEVFDGEDRQLEAIQDEGEQTERDLQEHSASVETDLGKIRDAGGRVRTRESTSELARTEEAASRDLEFLSGTIKRGEEALQKSECDQQEKQARAHGGRK